MIPKIIHYCWFGGNPFPPGVEKCIESWKRYCPDYEIIEWNESNFDINYNAFTEEAYKAKKWAFVSDVARLWILVNHGGIYMDTDCEVVQNIDKFLSLDAVSGFELPDRAPTGMMGCIKGHELFKELLAEYETRHFLMPDGTYDMTSNVVTINRTLMKHGLVPNNTLQTVANFTVYPTEYFCPKDWVTDRLSMTVNTHVIHHFTETWLEEGDFQKIKVDRYKFFCKVFGKKLGRKIYRAWYAYKRNGIFGLFVTVVEKIRRRKK